MFRDYPFRYANDEGPKTGSMGTVSGPELFLGLSDEHYTEVCTCIEAVIDFHTKKCGEAYKGILVGQFFYSADGIYFNEFDVRSGDPETINLLKSLDHSFSDIIESTVHGELSELHFNDNWQVTVCHVPRSYPDVESSTNIGIGANLFENECFFGSNMEVKDGELISGSGRSFTVLGSGENLSQAHNRANELSLQLGATMLDFRNDIGLDILEHE
jgi:phosphoribosylamine--glycine ligase